MIDFIAFIVIILAFVQGIMIWFKKSDIEYEKNISKTKELMEYLSMGYYRSFDGDGKNILMIASNEKEFWVKKSKSVNYNFLDVIKRCVDMGFDINEGSKKNNTTALHFACQYANQTEAAKYLLSRGANVNAVNDLGRTPFWIVCFSGNYALYHILITKTRGINIQDIDGYSPLMVAAREGHIGMVNNLLDNGANVHLKTKEGKNAYIIANENKSRHYKSSSNSASSDISYARHNHNLNEMVRRLYCLSNGIKFKPAKFKKPDMGEHFDVDE